MHYDGVCGNVHGHNIEWEVDAVIDMDYAGKDNMPVDLKDVSDILDTVDHALILCEEDPLVHNIAGARDMSQTEAKEVVENLMGEVYWFEEDPTCEAVAEWMANKIIDELDAVFEVELTVHETDKYGIGYATDEPRRLEKEL